jgi:hypothetical protein
MTPDDADRKFRPVDPENPSDSEIAGSIFLTSLTTQTRDMADVLKRLHGSDGELLKRGLLESASAFGKRRVKKAKENLLNLLAIAGINLDFLALNSKQLESIEDREALKTIIDEIVLKLRKEADRQKVAIKESKGLRHPQEFFVLTTLAGKVRLLKSAYLWEAGDK